jgi:hypothetical protein
MLPRRRKVLEIDGKMDWLQIEPDPRRRVGQASDRRRNPSIRRTDRRKSAIRVFWWLTTAANNFDIRIIIFRTRLG